MWCLLYLWQGGTMDLFVVNSFGSAYQVNVLTLSNPINLHAISTLQEAWNLLMYEQAVFLCLLLPFLSNLWGIPFAQLPNYFKDGAACFLNIGVMTNSKSWFLYISLSFIFLWVDCQKTWLFTLFFPVTTYSLVL